MPPDPGAAKATARAEQGTLRALGVPRVTVGSNPSVKSQAGLSAVVRPGTDCPVAGSTIDILALPCASAPETTDSPQDEVDRLPALTSAKRQAHQELLREIDEVRTLHHQPLETKLPRSGFEKLRQKQADRIVRDARAIKVFEASVAEISEGMERRVLEASYRFRDGREEVKEALSTVQRELAMDSRLVVGDMAYVQDMWDKLEAQCNRRVHHRQKFQGELEGVEIFRSKVVGRELRRLIDDMVSIAYRMPGEIERIAEEHASELNAVLINNRLAYAELLAKMEKEDFAVAVGVRRVWETRRDAWRCLRHDRALHIFHADLQALNFTNPPERVALFRGFKRGQGVRHERRIAVLLDLFGRRPVAKGEEGQGQSLTTEVVATILEEHETLHKEEIAAILEAREGLESIHNAKIEEARVRREALRAELHDYGAFSAEPDWEPLCLQVEAFVNGVKNEEFLRKAGELKHELVTLLQEMRSPDIMYDSCLLEVAERTELLLCGVDLERILDKQGKVAFRRRLVDSVERLRKAPKSDVPSILEVVRRQAADLAQIPEIDPLLASCLERSTEDIDKVVESIQRRGGGRLESRSGSERLSAGSKNSKRSGVGSKRSGSKERSGERSANGSGGGVGSRSSGAQSFSGTSRGAWESEIEIDTPQVRAVQRRLGMLASASDLSEGFKDELRGIRKALEQQRACNVVVDEVVQVETTGELDARFLEYSQLLNQTIRCMDLRAQDLHACAERFCCFFADVARELEAHDKRETGIDNAAENRIFDHKEDFRLADEDREHIVKATIDRVRMAADETELEVYFAKVLGLLDEVEESYRVYHKTAFEACAIHPMEVAKEAERIRAAVCAHVGLRPPSKEEVTSIYTGTDEKGGNNNKSGRGEEIETDNPSAEAKDKNTGEETPIEEAPAEGELTKVENYRAPGGSGAEYVIDRTLDKILQELLVQNTEDENAEDVNDSLTDDDGDETIDQTEGVRGLIMEAAGAATTGDVSAAADLPSHWRGTFVPLSREQVEALKVERGQEAVTEYLEKRGRRFQELSEEEQERLRIAAEAESVARSKAKKDAAKAKSKVGKKGGAKSKKSPKGATASSTSDVEGEEIEPPSVLEVYESVKREIEEYRAFRKEEIARHHAEKRLAPRDPEGEPVLEEISILGEDAAVMLRSLRDDLISRTECKAAAREASVGAACAEAQEMLTEELEERLRQHWPRKGRAEVGSRKPRDGELHAHRQKAHRFIRNVGDKLANQEKAFQEALHKSSSARKDFRQTVASMVEGLAAAASIAALQGMDSRCNQLVAAFEAEHQALQPKLERFVDDEPARLLRSCDDVTRLCKTFAEGGDYDSLELKELEELLKEPRQEISRAAEARRAALVEGVEAHEIVLQDEKGFKEEQTRCIMELSLREGLGQRYGAPRRNAQERLRSLIIRDDQCAETIQRLLDDLERLTVLRGDVIVDDMSTTEHFQRASMASGENGATDAHAEDPRGGTNQRIEGATSSPVTPAYGRSRTQLLRSSLISLREALFRHASFLEFLPAPEKVDRKRPVPGRGIEESVDEECRNEMEEIDPEVMLMPHDGETFAVSLDSLEGRCRSETRELYKSEGKEELLGEGGVPESLRTWLQESRERALGEGGHQQRSQRRLREQVKRFEFLIAKRPVPRNPTLEPRAPVLMLLDTSNRLEKEVSTRRTKREAIFDKSIALWDATRTNHIRLLRPALGSDDRRHELDELLAAETKRAAEVTAAITEFRRELIEQEAAGVRDRARKVAGCYKGVAAILDSVIMGDDLGKLPGDEDQEIKRKGLRRLRKADRAFLRQEKHEQQSPLPKPTKDGRKKPATKTERDLVIGKDEATTSRDEADKDPSSQGEGRQWDHRKWRTSGLSDLTRVVLSAATAASAEGPSVDFIAILKSTTIDIIAPEEDSDPSALLAGGAGSSKGGKKGNAMKKEKKAVPKEAMKKEKKAVPKEAMKKERKAVLKEVVNEEPPEVVEARKRAEEQKAEVRAWEEELRGAFEEETLVTTAHRALVAARDAFVTELTEKAKNIVVELLERYGRMLEAELTWGTKWKQLYTDLIKSAEAS